jgi:putative transposase
VLDEILQRQRDKKAAKCLLCRLMKRHGFVPKRFITDKLRSYGAAMREIAPDVEHGLIKASTIGLRTAIYHSENANERCKIIGRRAVCSGSCRYTPSYEIASLFQPAVAPP